MAEEVLTRWVLQYHVPRRGAWQPEPAVIKLIGLKTFLSNLLRFSR